MPGHPTWERACFIAMKPDMHPFPPDDAWLETILREQRSDYINDDGFTVRVVDAMPRHGRRRTWLLALATVLGCSIAGSFGGSALLEVITSINDSLVWEVIVHPMAPTYLLLGATMLFAAGSAWWALARLRVGPRIA